ncbi:MULTISPECIES: DUF4309 domain-containing protein [unclassified Paenibacillus]|uniref:DUF4309 domain-containing protein n=1 Tax=unclassified Paenibacillus TaxID=185978 RepID=UPI00093131E9|nr:MULTISPECIES: DUF4309 domain-containing protein [unclassified Paenibacillus]
MKRKKSFIGFLSVAICLAAFSAGCQSKQPASPPVAMPTVTDEQPAVIDTPVTHPETDTHSVDSSVPSPATPQTSNEKVSLASADKEAAPETKSDETKGKATNTSPKPKFEIENPYTQAKPTLLGITLKTNAAGVLNKFGKPKEEFVMDEDADPLTVYDYGDFLIGFNGKKEVHFIDVRSADIDPGLGGLKLGDPAAGITKVLGTPTANSNYVITYKATGAILKLDIDPKTQKINSIKLFAE